MCYCHGTCKINGHAILECHFRWFLRRFPHSSGFFLWVEVYKCYIVKVRTRACEFGKVLSRASARTKSWASERDGRSKITKALKAMFDQLHLPYRWVLVANSFQAAMSELAVISSRVPMCTISVSRSLQGGNPCRLRVFPNKRRRSGSGPSHPLT